MTNQISHYRPVLLARQGERLALQDLSDEDHEKFTPVFVVPPRAWNYDNEDYDKTLEQHVQKLPTELAKARGKYPAFLDLLFLNDESGEVYGQHPLRWICAAAAKEGLELTPVITPGSPEGLIRAAHDLIEETGIGVALRLFPKEWPSADPKGFHSFLIDLGIGTENVNLILDLGPDTATELTLRALVPEIEWALANGSWKSLTVAGAGMPKELPAGKGVHTIDRSDWETFQNARRLVERNPLTTLDFADYGVAGFDPSVEINPRFLNISASFRYTTENSWLFARGDLFKGNGGRSLGGAAVAPMLTALRSHGSYGLTERDAANEWIDGVIAGGSGGNSTVWRRWGTFHHVKTVLGQLAN